MIALIVWHVRTWYWRLVGCWERRHMRRQAPPPPRIIVVAVRPRPDPHTATLRERFATGAVAPGRGRALRYHEYARIAQAVRAEHQEMT